jgi:hypothetical protein
MPEIYMKILINYLRNKVCGVVEIQNTSSEIRKVSFERTNNIK